ncbi:UDP-N-acetylmuramate--L-alanine ligase [Clostridium tepidiprofundi DSM 19306]|uniref:UDP-N-acetylmuramate--L-alanine ligase n=1 Tax=Clostridium tepidiprofundi DSM 19306 TaxID=1121338 RepID=A0A151B358_9CLOT|nr:UDP-N-acetylmuramate--L-alanine ligase [Clostridium tepidiprofundi]KYH34354.1 UDP-N-acetylmuramate--L-alanine ligase [Clostridium tepidiprofundi DSM 19306]
MSFDFINDRHKKIHFIGIGGISMSGLAEILIENGYKVSGSDVNSSHITDSLKNNGAEIFIGHKANNVDGSDIVVYTAAISKDNPEILKAKELNIPLMDRATFLGEIMKGHKYNVAVAGTHGKTTTTSMLSHIVIKENLDPTILVGGELDIISGNVRTGNSDYFITEACEYKESFLKFYPYIGIILNIDADHLDYYKNIEHIKDTFAKFIKLIPENGYAVINYDDENAREILKHANCNIITYGLKSGTYTARNINYDKNGCAHFDLYKENKKLFSINLNVPGEHNVLNALASICASICLNISQSSIINGLYNFHGTHRRFEIKGVKNNITVIDDYAHHPTEIKATIKTANTYPHKKIFCVFQPHTYTRTLSLFDEFSEAFYGVDTLILADIYSASREKDTGIVSSDMLGNSIRDKGINCLNLHSFCEIAEYLNKHCNEGDIILTVGAGDIYKVGEIFLENY